MQYLESPSIYIIHSHNKYIFKNVENCQAVVMQAFGKQSRWTNVSSKTARTKKLCLENKTKTKTKQVG